MPFFSKFRQQILAFLGIPHDLFKKSHFVHFDDYMSAWQIPLTKGILNHILRARAFHDMAVTQKNSTPFEVICDNTWWKSFFINYSPFLATFDFHRYLRWEFFTASGRQFLRQKIWWTNFEKYYQQTGKNMTTIFLFCVKTKWHIYIYTFPDTEGLTFSNATWKWSILTLIVLPFDPWVSMTWWPADSLSAMHSFNAATDASRTSALRSAPLKMNK